MKVPLFQIDAFTSTLFSGNPAAVCLLEGWVDDDLLQQVAAENNLPETAFLVRSGTRFELRWFTPTVEINLCGHATLASAFVIWNFLQDPSPSLSFQTHSGLLTARRREDLILLSFPVQAAVKCEEAPRPLIEGLGSPPREVWAHVDPRQTGNYLAVYAAEREILDLQPDFDLLASLPGMGVIATAPGRTADFVSRYFAPGFGIPEDPVTGSSHCTLVPYWAARIEKEELHALQLSSRGGELFCRLLSDRVEIGGRAVCYLEGSIRLG